MKKAMIAAALTLLSRPSGAVSAELGVPSGYQQVAAEYAIPPQIFYAVALTESGRRVEGSAALHPWPWTLNIRGKAHFFRERRAAERALHHALEGGEDLIDVGLMQVNWRFHQARLGSPSGALDPYRNLRIAARILHECHRERADWWAAVGCYHAPADPARAAKYRSMVRQHWRRLRRTS